MRASLLLVLVGLVFWGSGCGQPAPPRASGKPLDYWVQAAADPKAAVRREALRHLGNAGPENPAVLPTIQRALSDPEPSVRRAAILALVQLGPAAQEALPRLADLSQHDRDPQVRQLAHRAWTQLQTINRSVSP